MNQVEVVEISFWYSNVSSVVNKLDEWKVRVLAKSPTIIMLTETWLRDGLDDSIINLDGYSIFRNDRPNQRGGGACIFVKDEVDGHQVRCSLSEKYITDMPIDAVWLDIQIVKIKTLVACRGSRGIMSPLRK